MKWANVSVVFLCAAWLGFVTTADAAVESGLDAPNAPRPLPVLLVELEDAPAAEVYLDGVAAKQSAQSLVSAVRQQQDLIKGRQQDFVGMATNEVPKARPLYRMNKLINGVAFLADGDEAEQLRRLPGVKAVHVVPLVEPALQTTLPFLHVPEVWSSRPDGLTGKAVSIGIIDTGIDYLHADLGGPGTREAYFANNAAVIGDAPFPNERVVGGYDFAGEFYDPTDVRYAVPIPDLDPLDMRAHGTHVAGIAAGNGVLSAASQHYGPYTADTRLDRYLVAPGVAPEAVLYALKIFGPIGGSNLAPLAVDWSIDPNDDGDFSDRIDIINLSLSAPYAKPPDAFTISCDAAARLGVVVVASAGNDGDVYFIAGTPGGAPRAICVGASMDDDPMPGEGWGALFPDVMAWFSSRGPLMSGGRLILKPDVTAPGVAVTSANFLTSDREFLSSILSGTSMAAPHVAGVLALLKQQHPDWSVEELKALIMNTATPNVYALPDEVDPKVALSRMGAGRIDPVAATRSDAIVFDAARPWEVSMAFQTTEVLGSADETRTLRVLNKGDKAVSFKLGVQFVTPLAGVDVQTSQIETGPIAPGEHVDVAVTLSAVAREMRHERSADLLEKQVDQPRQWLSELSGFVVLEPEADGVPIRLPFYGVLRPVAAMAQQIDVMDFTRQSSLELALSGASLPGGKNRPFDVVPLVTPLELLCFLPRTANPFETPDAAFLKYMGVTSDFEDVGRVVSKTTVTFGFAAYGTWNTPQQGLYLFRIDIDSDGVPDFTVYNGTFWEPFSGLPFEYSDVHVVGRGLWSSLYQGLANGRALNYHAPSDFDTAVFMNDVMVLPMSAHSLGLREGGHTEFDFWVETFFSDRSFLLSIPDHKSPVMHHDIRRPGLVFPNGSSAVPTFEDKNGGRIPIRLNTENYTRDEAKGLLLLHHHNSRATRAEWVKVITPGDSDLDGIPDADENVADVDQDGFPNLVDEDSDDDGIPDALEGQEDVDGDLDGNYIDFDSDNDTLLDVLEGITDSDRDGAADAYDIDADGDDILDIIELDGDVDGDGVPNYLDLDSDGDSLPDWLESDADTDGDGTPNFLDLDSDADGLSDLEETAVYGTAPYDFDTDGDGVADAEEVSAGSNPLLAQAPQSPPDVRATLGAYPDHVHVLWGKVPGRVSYRVYRSATGNAADAVPVSDWMQAAAHDDFTASPARYLPANGCSGELREFVYYTYFVKARNGGGESGLSLGAQGCRGLP